MSKDEVIMKLATRDSISFEEAKKILEDAAARIQPLVKDKTGIDTAFEIWEYEIGLPPEDMFEVIL